MGVRIYKSRGPLCETPGRQKSLDFVLIVENYITQQKNFVSKSKEERKVVISEPIANQNTTENDVMPNGGIVKVMMDYYINFQLAETTIIQRTETITVNVQTQENL